MLDKRWSPHNELTDFHWSGNAHKVTRGISFVNLLATHESDCTPVDYRVYEGIKGKTNKNEHALAMLVYAKKRGFKPQFVMADCWYSSLLNMKAIVRIGWKFIFGMNENRLVNETQGTYVAVSSLGWTQK